MKKNGISLNNGCHAFITYHLDEDLRNVVHQNFEFLGSLERSEYIHNLSFLVIIYFILHIFVVYFFHELPFILQSKLWVTIFIEKYFNMAY